MTGLQILNEVADRVGWPQIDTLDKRLNTNERKLVRLLNRALATLGGQQDWPALQTDATLTLIGSETSDLTSGSEEYVVVTKGSKQLQVLNKTFDETYIGRAIQVSGDEYVYRIKRIVSTDTVELSFAWASDSVTSADKRTYTIAMDQYALPDDFDRPIDEWASMFAPYGIEPVSPQEFREIRRQERNISPDDPSIFTVWGMNDKQSASLVHFHPFPKDARVLHYTYVRTHPEIKTDSDRILYPPRYVALIVESMIELIRRDLDDDDNLQAVMLDLLRTYNEQLTTQGPTAELFQLRPANSIRRSMRRALGRFGSRINWGTYFDRFLTK